MYARARRSKTLQSSSKQAAGRARPGRGPRVPRKPQAAQVEPNRRHRKSRASDLPFLRGDLLTEKREVPPDGRKPAPGQAPARGSSGAAAQRPARCCQRRRGEAASIAIREGEGRGPDPSWAERLSQAAERGGGGASRRSWQRPAWPPRGALRTLIGQRR